MRRMMHAAIFGLFCLGSVSVAQQPNRNVRLAYGSGNQSLLSQPAPSPAPTPDPNIYSGPTDHSGHAHMDGGSMVLGSPSDHHQHTQHSTFAPGVVHQAPTAGCQSCNQGHSMGYAYPGGPELAQFGCNGPYSQLGVRMAWNEASPNLWGTYACERSHRIAKLMRHVDMQCGCNHHCGSGCGSQLYADPSIVSGHGGCFGKHGGCFGGHGSCGCGDSGCLHRHSLAAKLNRYQTSCVSTLYAEPGVACGGRGGCGLGKHRRFHHGGSAAICDDPGYFGATSYGPIGYGGAYEFSAPAPSGCGCNGGAPGMARNITPGQIRLSR